VHNGVGFLSATYLTRFYGENTTRVSLTRNLATEVKSIDIGLILVAVKLWLIIYGAS